MVPEELKRLVDELTDEVRGLRAEAHVQNERALSADARAERAERKADRTRSWLQIIALALATAILVAGGVGLAVTKRADSRIEQNNQKWCGTLNILTDPDAPAPSTPRGRDQLAQLERLRRAFGCDRSDMPPPAPSRFRPGS